MKSGCRKKILFFFLGWLTSLLVVGFFATLLPSFQPEIRAQNSLPFFRWDSAWQESVARDGYFFVRGENSNIAFFPLFPWLVKALDGFWGLGFGWTAFLLNGGLTFATSLFLFKLMRLDHSSRLSYRTVLVFLTFPSTFFFLSAYAEALFVFLVVTFFYATRKKQWPLSGVIAALAAITKPYGISLWPILVVEYFLSQGQSGWRERKVWSLVLPLIFFAAFLFFNHSKFGNWLAFAETQESWGRTFTWPWLTYFGYAHELLRGNVWGVGNAHFLLNFVAVTIYLIFLPVVFGKARFSYFFLYLFFALPALLSGTFTSFFRYLLPIFPLFSALAVALSKRNCLFLLYLICSFLTLLFLAGLFVRWFPCF